MMDYQKLSGYSFSEIEAEWVRLDELHEAITKQERLLNQYADKQPGRADKDAGYTLAKQYQDEAQHIGFILQEIEGYLIENEAPGWTST